MKGETDAGETESEHEGDVLDEGEAFLLVCVPFFHVVSHPFSVWDECGQQVSWGINTLNATRAWRNFIIIWIKYCTNFVFVLIKFG